VTALIGQGAALALPMPLLGSVLEINRGQAEEMLRLMRRHYRSLEGVNVSVLGIAFKQDTDDVRESPAFPIIRCLLEAGARVTAYDPVARPAGHEGLRGVALAGSLPEAVESADVIALVTRWKEFEQLPQLLRHRSPPPLVVDGRRLLDPRDYVRYEGIGRG
jgi:UDPglucose 6-dehydrogenase/GDP-mannose 6-dehydrogenase